MPSFKLQVCAVRLINPLKSMQRIKAWKGMLRLRAYNEPLLQQIGNSDRQW